MYRIINRGLFSQLNLKCVENGKISSLKGLRCVTTQNPKSDSLFPNREDFPSRHIGPRDHDIVTMLDLMGYKVKNRFHYLGTYLTKIFNYDPYLLKF